MKEYLKKAQEVIDEINGNINGLSREEVSLRQHKFGHNKLNETKKQSLVEKFLEKLIDPMTIVLIIAALISAITSVYSNESFADVIIIALVVIINAVLGVLQESKAEKALDALKEITAATSKVLRNGNHEIVKSEEIVPGDIIILEAGDLIPADARVIESASLKVEESALTGESLPVDKISDALKVSDKSDVPLGDRKNMVYTGSTVVYGRGKAVVTGIGMNTEIGKIANALSSAKEGQTPLQIKLTQLSKTLSFIILGICVAIFLIDVFRLYPNISTQGILDSFMVAVSLAVAAIPEGLAAVVTIVLSIGVTNMSKRNAVMRKLMAVETLGCTQVICSDKTGTLTQNKMTVVESVGDDENLLAIAMSMCSDAELDESGNATGEPTECALVNYSYKIGLPKNKMKNEYNRIGEAPFDSDRKMMSTVHKKPNNSVVQFTKGAPDEVLKHCDKALVKGKVVPLTDDLKEQILKQNKSLADKALRVLCAATREWQETPQNYSPQHLENSMCYIGLVGMIDPIRPEVKDSIRECHQAGIKTVMITGDHKNTAVAIAKQLGIINNEGEAITGEELDKLSEEELNKNVKKYSVYARVQPEHKVRIVKAWQNNGNITAMTGDGVNDAPSIKNADIGVGMGVTGTDVTKNIADMVLADDNFTTIVFAVEEGRRIYDNIRKTIQFLLASNLSEVLSIFFATLLGFVILKPIHLLWINLITDSLPALALGFEESEKNIMKRPPRDSKEGIFAQGMFYDIVIQGFLTTVITLMSYFIGHFIESGKWEIVNSNDGVTMAFLTLSMTEVFHAFNMRSRRGSTFKLKGQNKYLWYAMVISLVCTALVIYVPFLSEAFEFEHISLFEYFISIALAFTIIPMVEIIKFIQRKLNI